MFEARRGRLMRTMRGGVAVFAAGHEQIRNGDVHYEFRQDSTFHYITGFPEPDAVAVLRPGSDRPYVLFVRPRDPDRAIWDGTRSGVDGALQEYGADSAYPIDELEDRLPELLANSDSIYFSLGSDERVERIVRATVESNRGAPSAVDKIVDPSPLVAAMRLVKSATEVRLLQRAVDITGAGLATAMQATQPGMYEYQVQAVLDAKYRQLGSQRNGFPSIVASGANSCILHYPDPRGRVEDGELLLIDTGAEVDYYGADITRTFPANGHFGTAQRAVYDIVLDAQEAAIETVAPGTLIEDVHNAALRVLVRGLRTLSVLEGRTDRLIKRGDYRPYFMHGTSHWLGLDVHDVGGYRQNERSTELRPGMVLTVEPGLYFGPDSEAPKQLRGIGVRIEDDVLVTRNGHRNLSANIPSDPTDLENIVDSVC